MTGHPAKYSPTIMAHLTELLRDRNRFPGMILDPFAGTGRIHNLERDDTIGIELEAEWAEMHPRTITGDALDLVAALSPDHLYGEIGTICTSPTYGNRMADTYDGRDGTRRHTYTVDLGRPLTSGNTGGLQWGPHYRHLHLDAWISSVNALDAGGAFILNCSDHIRKGARQYVTGWHVATLTLLGLELETWDTIQTARQRHGANGAARVEGEAVVVLRKPTK
jgi:hypothetical protein